MEMFSKWIPSNFEHRFILYYYIILYYIILYYITLYYIVLYYTIIYIYYIVQFYPLATVSGFFFSFNGRKGQPLSVPWAGKRHERLVIRTLFMRFGPHLLIFSSFVFLNLPKANLTLTTLIKRKEKLKSVHTIPYQSTKLHSYMASYGFVAFIYAIQMGFSTMGVPLNHPF